MITEKLKYITLEDAIDIHKRTIYHSGGGTHAYLNLGQLESLLQHIQNDDYYPTFIKKLTHLFFGVCKFHCFADGNKRLAITLTAQFLLINGYLAIAKTYFRETENISYHVAAGHIDEDLLERVLGAIIEARFESDESLKLELAIAESIEDNY